MLKKATIYSIFFITVLFFLISCESNNFSKIENTKKSLENKKELLQDIQSECNLALPKNTTLISHGDGQGGVANSKKYYEWLLKSSEKIEIPKMYEYSDLPYYKEPLADALYTIQCRIANEKLSKPLEAIGSKFETRKNTYKYHRLKTIKGYYLLIERFKRIPTYLSKASIPEIIILLKNENKDKRISAIQELGLGKKNSASITALIDVLADSNEDVCRQAHIALKKLTQQKNIDASHSKWQKWWEANKDRILKEEAGKDRLEKENAEKEKVKKTNLNPQDK